MILQTSKTLAEYYNEAVAELCEMVLDILPQESDALRSSAQQRVDRSGGCFKVVIVMVLLTPGDGRRLTAWHGSAVA